VSVSSLMALQVRGRGTNIFQHQMGGGVTKLLCRRTVLERPAVVGKSPVSGTHVIFVFCIPSSAGTEQIGVNLRGPPRKPKYSLATDSEPVP
jgi:hypothetical protein